MISKVIASTCLILIHFLETFDSFGVDGVIPILQQHYNINDSETAIIKTATSVLNTCTLALIWIFGDVFKHRRLFLVSVIAWITFSLISTLLGSSSFIIFVLFRSFGAAASSIIGVVSPALLGDLFEDRSLGVSLMFLSISEIAGPMLAGIVSSWIVSRALPWQLGLIVVTILAIPLLIVLLSTNFNSRNKEKREKNRGLKAILADATGIISSKSYALITLAYSLSQFQKRAYNFWFPSMYVVVWNNVPDIFMGLSYTTVTTINTIDILLSTAVGLPITLWISQNWRHGKGFCSGRKEFPRAFPIIMSVGSALGTVAFLFSVIVLDKSYFACLAATFLVGFGGAPDACLRQLMLIMVVPPKSRAAAFALTQLIVEIVTIPSAQIVGTITDLVRGDSTLPYDRFHAYQLVLLCTSSILIASVLLYIILIYFFPADCKRAQETNGKCDEETRILLETSNENEKEKVEKWTRMSSVSSIDHN